jgi:DNA gyrase subunit A
VSAIQVNQEDEVMLISNKGTLVRVPVSEISVIGRNTQGVRLIQLSDSEVLVSLERIASIKEGENKE